MATCKQHISKRPVTFFLIVQHCKAFHPSSADYAVTARLLYPWCPVVMMHHCHCDMEHGRTTLISLRRSDYALTPQGPSQSNLCITHQNESFRMRSALDRLHCCARAELVHGVILHHLRCMDTKLSRQINNSIQSHITINIHRYTYIYINFKGIYL